MLTLSMSYFVNKTGNDISYVYGVVSSVFKCVIFLLLPLKISYDISNFAKQNPIACNI